MGVVVGTSVFANVRAAAAMLVPVGIVILGFKKSLSLEGLFVFPSNESSSTSAACTVE
jgi:hypothetical protein